MALTNTVGVIVRDNGDVALVDTGFSTAACHEPSRILGMIDAKVFGLQQGEATSIAEQLAGVGIDSSRVKTVIATHLHRDHIQGVCDFPNAELLTSEAELAAFKTSRLGGFAEDDLGVHRASGRLKTFAFTHEKQWAFDRSYDLFGDGSVRLLDAHGHTRGSVAVAMRRHDAWYMHIGDAAYRQWEYREARTTLLGKLTRRDSDGLRETQGRLLASEQTSDAPRIIPSHDETVFRDLPHRPLVTF